MSATTEPGIVIVGAGHAGIQAAFALRKNGWSGAVTVFDHQPHLPYERPPLSKDALLGDGVAAVPLRKEAMYAAKEIDLITGIGVTALDVENRVVVAGDGTRHPYSALLLATGARARQLPVPGAGLDGVHLLRTLDEAVALEAALVPGRRAVVVGAGYIGLEATAAAVKAGLDVTVVEAADRVLARVASGPVSAFAERLHRDRGAQIRLATGVAEILGTTRVEGVRLTSGEVLPADLVIAGIGVVPNDELAADAGIAVDDGILVDATGRTSAPDVYAAGDVARVRDRADGAGRGTRLECIQGAVVQAETVAAQLTGRAAPTDTQPWFWTVQYGVRVQSVGLPAPSDEIVLRGDPAGGSFSVLYLRDERLTALDTVHAVHDFVPGKKLITARSVIDRRLAADPAVKLSRTVLTAV